MKRAVGYIRVSSSSQASPEKTSLERQAEKIELQARLKEYQLTKIYREPGISGATMERPALQELMADAEAHKFDAVIVWDISRFGRNLLHLKQNTERLKELRIGFIAIDNGIDTSSRDKTGELLLNILASIYEFELETIKERTSDGRDRKRKNKEYFPGKLAYGYRWNEQELRVETVPAEAKIVIRIFREYIYENRSTPTIAEGLQNDHEVTRAGGKWSDGYIYKILHNSCYTGTYITNQHLMNSKGKVIGMKPESEWVYHDCEPFIEPADWERLQERLRDGRAKFAGAPNPESKKYLADGLLRCGLCGGTMRLKHTRPNKAGHCRSYYECYWHGKSERAASVKGRQPCAMQPIPAALMDNHLFELRLPLQLGLVWEKQYEDQATPSVLPELERAKQRVENIQNAIKTNKIMITNNDRTQGLESFDPLKYNTRNAELTQVRANLQRQLIEAEREVARYERLFQNEQSFQKIQADKDTIMELFRRLLALRIDQRRQLLHGLVDGDIVVTPLGAGPLDVSDPLDGNVLNGWTKIRWKYNPLIIKDILLVIIPNIDETTGEVLGGCFHTPRIRMLPDGSPKTKTTRDASGWLWIRKHTGYVQGVFHELRS